MKMSLHYTRLCVLVSIIFLLYQVSESTKPVISPSEEEIVINEEQPLTIACTGFIPIKFTHPKDVNKTLITTTIKVNEANGVYKYIFHYSKPHFGDTGWYGCAYENVEIIPNDYDNPEVQWIYVYVKSTTNFFVEEEDYTHLSAIVDGTVTIPCRPTSPDLPMPTLININHDENEKQDVARRTSFNPRIGFTIGNLTVRDSEWYRCSINNNGEEQEINYVLAVYQKQDLPKPNIHDDSLRHVTRGQDLYVNCSVIIDTFTRYVMNWTTPQNSNRISTQDFREVLGIGNDLLATCQLTIFNVTDEDAGEYECIIRSLHGQKSTKSYVTIHDPEIKYINLTPQHDKRYHEMENGDTVQWVVYVDGYPKPHIQWFKPNGEEIMESAKYSTNESATTTFLQIRSLNTGDSGDYILEAKNDYKITKLNFTLNVIGKPAAILAEIETYYAPDKIAEFHCVVLSNPSPNITWSFLGSLNYPSFENSTVIQLPNVTQDDKSNYGYDSRARMIIQVSGMLTCQACNVFGCDSVTENIFVSDGVGAFGIIGPEELVTKGDNIELICAASIYNYTNEFQWRLIENKTEISLVETERLQIVSNKTSFTYRSTLKINDVQESDAGDYICIGKCTNQTYGEVLDMSLTEYANYKLTVHDAVWPFFTAETNMNETVVKNIDVNTEGHKTVILKCFAGGMPKPNVTWYKDNVLLKRNDQFFFKFNHQELNIKYLKEDDSGKYTCQLRSRLGTIETHQQIMVKNTKSQNRDMILAIPIAFLSISFIILVIFVTIKIRREKKMRKELMEAGLMHFEEGALECLNPELTVDDQAELLPYDKKWEFPRERLKLGKQLGSGAFGVVMKAEAQGICEEETVTTVAVKMVRRTTDPTYVRALASELKIMVHLGKHLNVVNLLGACTKNISKRELLVIVEYCRFGNLHNYLLRHRSDFINQIDSTGKIDLSIGADILTRSVSISSSNRIKYAALSFSRSLSVNSGTDSVIHYCPGTGPDSQEISFSPDGCILSNDSSQPGWRSNYRGDYKDQNLKPICTQDLLSWAFQVARGMEYLSQRRVLHGDLAARNILLAENNVVKICDFGLAKTMYKDGNYKKKGDGPLPIKWMAIESIRDRIFSTQSDIWSFGIVLWEFFTLAETPYPGMEAEKQYQKLIEGYRMEHPEYAMREVYNIMLQCWKAKPTLRPSFTDLVESIGNLLEESVRSHYISLNVPYMDMNTMILESGKSDYLTMMSAPDHVALSSPSHEYTNTQFPEGASDSAYLCMSPGCQTDESGIFSPRPNQEHSHFEFPSFVSDSEDAVEASPMLKKEEDPYLKPINVQERRAEFARQREAMKNQIVDRPIDRDSGYCNTPRNLHLIDLNDGDETDANKQADSDKEHSKKKNYVPSIIHTQDNYVNMPKQKDDLKKGMPDSYSNPSYVMMNNMDQRT